MKKVTERKIKLQREKEKSRRVVKLGRFRIFFFFSFRLEGLAEWLVILVNVATVPPSSGDDVMMLYQSVVLGRYIHKVCIPVYSSTPPATKTTYFSEGYH